MSVSREFPEQGSSSSAEEEPEEAGRSSDENALDRYAAEFAELVSRHAPARTDIPSEWVSRLPDELLRYYRAGIATFGRRAQTGSERRGRLYLLHTALVLMWMEWGKEDARKRFKNDAQRGVQRAASLITLEHYRRAGVVTDIRVSDWFEQPVGEWGVTVRSSAVQVDEIDEFDLRERVQTQEQIGVTVETFSALRAAGAVPQRETLSLKEGQ